MRSTAQVLYVAAVLKMPRCKTSRVWPPIGSAKSAKNGKSELRSTCFWNRTSGSSGGLYASVQLFKALDVVCEFAPLWEHIASYHERLYENKHAQPEHIVFRLASARSLPTSILPKA